MPRDYDALDLALDELETRRNALRVMLARAEEVSEALNHARVAYWEAGRRARDILESWGDPVIFEPACEEYGQ